MTDPGVMWRAVADLPFPNDWLVAGTLVSTVLLAWFMLGSLRSSLHRYPRRGEGNPETRHFGRRSWAVTMVLAGCVVWGVYRIGALLSISTAVPPIALAVEAFRLAGVLFLVWAYWPERTG